MRKIQVVAECDPGKGFHVASVSSKFDVPITEKLRKEIEVEIPDASDYQIGAIVGHSGSGKTLVARKASNGKLWEWKDRSEEWGNGPVIERISSDAAPAEREGMLCAVGFSSPPAWLRPYATLSMGERFRCDLAKALLDKSTDEVWFDEFASMVDPTSARTICMALSKSIRKGLIQKRVVLVGCHKGFTESLQPDWILDMSTKALTRGSVRRPDITYEIFSCTREAWPLFAEHHYLDRDISKMAQCYIATVDGEPAAFCATIHNLGWKNCDRIHRLVTLPTYQGIGAGTRLAAFVAQHRKANHGKKRVTITTSHPGLMKHFNHSPLWRRMSVQVSGNAAHFGAKKSGKPRQGSVGRAIASFEFL